MAKTKKRNKLILRFYKSGIEGKGKPIIKVVTSTLTAIQYRNKFYRSSYHERTEYALSVKKYKQRKKKEKKAFKKQYKKYKQKKGGILRLTPYKKRK